MLKPAGVTLVELLVALTLGGIVFGSAAVSAMRQQQAHRTARTLTGTDAQLSGALTVLGAQIAQLDRAGDLVDGELSDTALQFRAPIGFALACGTASGTITLGRDTSAVTIVSLAAVPKTGDTLWWRADSAWAGAQITNVTTATGVCTTPFSQLLGEYRVSISAPDTISVGTALRVTRQTRYSFYHASDGTWQLGFRESSGIPAHFAAPQPVVGPLILRLGARRTSLRYFDTLGAELLGGPGGVFATDVARVRITTHALMTGQAWWRDSVRSDSIDVALRRARGP